MLHKNNQGKVAQKYGAIASGRKIIDWKGTI
jgi:hypothetical protein